MYECDREREREREKEGKKESGTKYVRARGRERDSKCG